MPYTGSHICPVCFFGFGIDLKLKTRYLANYCPSSSKKKITQETGLLGQNPRK